MKSWRIYVLLKNTPTRYHWIILCFLCFCNLDILAQQASTTSFEPDAVTTAEVTEPEDVYVFIQNVNIIGNDKTKPRIITRELRMQAGDQILRDDLNKIIENDKIKLVNTRLFLTVEIKVIELPNNYVDILIEVKERWYLFPVPIFKVEARNFNDWWVNQNHSLDRVNYGVKFYQYNLRGRNERLKIGAQFGFTKKFEIEYSVPYIDKAQRHGLRFKFEYDENANIPYKTSDHVQVFANFGKQTFNTTAGTISYTHRPSFYSFHSFTLDYRKTEIKDSIAILNPNFFLDDRTSQQRFRFFYRGRKEMRDNIIYPLKGYMFNFEFEKLGLGIYDDINLTMLNADYFRYIAMGSNYFLSARIGGSISFPKLQPYYDANRLGYRPNIIRGYELNVMEGQNFAIHQLSIKKQLFHVDFRLNSIIKSQQFNTIPLTVYLKTFFDGGYVNNTISNLENSRLVNKYIFGTGVGIDFVTYYDFVMRIEYAINREGQAGFFLNFKSDIR